MALLSKFFGRTASEGAAYAFGVATGPVLAPATETIRQDAWNTHANRIPSAGTLAEGVAQHQVDEKTARSWAKKQGFDTAAFDALISIANVGPGMAQAFNLWRRKQVDQPGFIRALQRLGLEDEWITALWNVREEILPPADLARAIHRGLIPDPGLLQGTLPTGTGHVPAYPVYGIDALEEAQGSGYDRDRLGVLVGLQGLPMGSHEAAQALFRGVLTENDYLRAIAEGNTRNEWADSIKEQSRSIPSPTNYVAAFIRGWRTRAEMRAGAARHGMTDADADLLALIAGRPVTTRQAFIGWIRGGRVDGENWDERETFRRAVIQSNIRPEWEPILWASRYSYPSAFVLRALTQAGDITPAEAETILLYNAWEPTLAAKVSKAWSTGGAATAKGLTATDLKTRYEGQGITKTEYVNGLKELGYTQDAADFKVAVSDDAKRFKSLTQLRNRTRTQYTSWRIARQAASDALRGTGLTIALVNEILTDADVERELNVHLLTEPQVVKAYNAKLMEKAVAVDRLTELGLAPADIEIRLAISP